MAQRILVLPHIGTSLGHIIRLGSYLETRPHGQAHYIASIPRQHLASAIRFLPDFVEIIPRDNNFAVNNPTGRLDTDLFSKAIDYDLKLFSTIKPDLLVGDPGVRTGIVGVLTRCDWEALMHGCYLDLPARLPEAAGEKGRLFKLATLAWRLIDDYLNQLVAVGTRGRVSTWRLIRRTGRIVIPNSFDNEPLVEGEHLAELPPAKGMEKGRPYKFVLTQCTGNKDLPPSKLLSSLAHRYEEVAVVGATSGPHIEGVHYLGDKYELGTLVDENTIVLCHGGHGTLRTVVGKAKRIFAVPGDLDQVCNSIIGAIYSDVKLPPLKYFEVKLNSLTPFTREIDWSLVDTRQLTSSTDGVESLTPLR